ncbi:hypothetical protein BDY19DRAFT_953772 [Irpex rosettiformis]|uniref:Uncharacterized protein n=1 Tax=Irpex rosettiformis TaxID=378272 RepID=A0ACB8U1F2_9APHY|nr:hypothetical protein BDY19DRAFT_953772 [Irpex rosettiformis]
MSHHRHNAPSKDASYLEPSLKLAEGMLIMLKKNIVSGAALVSGTLGVVEHMNLSEGIVYVSLFRGPSSHISVKIVPWTAPISTRRVGNMQMTRTQLPIRPGFAETIYKAQGGYTRWTRSFVVAVI